MEVRSIAEIMLQLHQTGSLAVPRVVEPGELERAMWEIASERELEASGSPSLHPRVDIATAAWAATRLVEGARCLLFRDIEEGDVHAMMNAPAPNPPDPVRAWSADLAFRFLPDLLHRACAVSEDDVLSHALARLLAAWSLKNWPADPFIAAVLTDRDPAQPSPNDPVERPWLVPVPSFAQPQSPP